MGGPQPDSTRANRPVPKAATCYSRQCCHRTSQTLPSGPDDASISAGNSPNVSGVPRPQTGQRLSGLADRSEVVHVLDLHDDLINPGVDEGLGALAHLFRVTAEQSLLEIGVPRTAHRQYRLVGLRDRRVVTPHRRAMPLENIQFVAHHFDRVTRRHGKIAHVSVASHYPQQAMLTTAGNHDWDRAAEQPANVR